jgi:hypothetical protein
MTLWDSRDAPALRHLVEHPPEHGVLETHYRSDQPRAGLPALTEAELYRAVEVLGDAGYVAWSGGEGEGGGGRYYFDFQVTGEGKRVLGLWPRLDALASPEELAAVLEALAEGAPTEEERSALEGSADVARRTVPGLLRSLRGSASSSAISSTTSAPRSTTSSGAGHPERGDASSGRTT